MDNFDLKKYLVENKVTRNSRMLNEEEYRTFEQGAGFYVGTVDQTKIYSMEDFSVVDTAFYALDTEGEVSYVSVDVAGEKVTPRYVSEETGVDKNVAAFIAKDINDQLEDYNYK